MRPYLIKIFCLFGIIAFMTAIGPANGAEEKVVLGQYEVSFDLDTSLAYTIEPQLPIVRENDTSYSAYIKFANETQILMGIDVFKAARDATLEPMLEIVQLYSRGDENATVVTRSVDGKTGVQTSSLSASGDPTFTFRSWIDSEKCDCGEVYAGTAKLEIIGIVPTNISDSLLETLHVAAASARPGTQTGAAASSELEGVTISKEFYIDNMWLNEFYPTDPAYYQLDKWANM